LPSLALGIAGSGLIARQMRAGLANSMSSNYASSLTAAGVSRRRFYLRYGLKNAMVPVLAATGITLAILIGASFAVERVFSIPGVGDMMLTSVVGKDFPVVQGGVLVIALFVILLNLALDVGYGLINPQTRPQ
jgi:peptide/nickel transport system permease protein